MTTSRSDIPDAAVVAAARAILGVTPDVWEMQIPRTKDRYLADARDALEAAAPHMLADYLLTLAADVRTRGDIGRDDGVEAWDYLTRQAEKIRPTP